MCKANELNAYAHTVENLVVGGKKYQYYSLPKLCGPRLGQLPFCIRVILETLARNCDDVDVTQHMVEATLDWKNTRGTGVQILFKPTRVIFQDFVGLPALANIAALREAVGSLGGNPTIVEPECHVDLVIDQSVNNNYSRSPLAVKQNQEAEWERNRERFEFLKWCGVAFRNVLVIPPGAGIAHQVNLEHLSRVVTENGTLLTPDSVLGTGNHTTLINGLGVIGWAIGGIESEAVLLGQGVRLAMPDVIGYELKGEMMPWVTSTDVVLTITKHLKESGVEGKMVEFFGPSVGLLSIAERAAIASMCPEYGAVMGFFPLDNTGLQYLKQTGRSQQSIDVIEAYLTAQCLLKSKEKGAQDRCCYTSTVSLDLATVVPSVSGPKRPQDRVPVKALKAEFLKSLISPLGFKGYGLARSATGHRATFTFNGQSYTLTHGSVVVAAITGCTNSSSPSAMLGAGLLAVKAVARGLHVAPYIRTSLSPGSAVAGCYLKESDTIAALEQLGFHLTGYGCMACAGNTQALPEDVGRAIEEQSLVTCAVLSGNKNWENRLASTTKATYLASPLLVIACAIAGTVAVDFATEPLGKGQDGSPVYLSDIWPTREELQEVERRCVVPNMYRNVYSNIQNGNASWNKIKVQHTSLYPWKKMSTHVKCPPFVANVTSELPRPALSHARVLLWLGDNVSTDVISPAGAISRSSAAAFHLSAYGLAPKDFGSYGSRRGNHEVMARGTFSSPNMENRIVKGRGPYTLHWPTGKLGRVYDVAAVYSTASTPLLVLAGQNYGVGPARDWAARGPWLLGVRAVLAESFDYQHKKSLVAMGIWPLCFLPGQSAASLGLIGSELFDMALPAEPVLPMNIFVKCGTHVFTAVLDINGPDELHCLRQGGLLPMKLRQLVSR